MLEYGFKRPYYTRRARPAPRRAPGRGIYLFGLYVFKLIKAAFFITVLTVVHTRDTHTHAPLAARPRARPRRARTHTAHSIVYAHKHQ